MSSVAIATVKPLLIDHLSLPLLLAKHLFCLRIPTGFMNRAYLSKRCMRNTQVHAARAIPSSPLGSEQAIMDGPFRQAFVRISCYTALDLHFRSVLAS